MSDFSSTLTFSLGTIESIRTRTIIAVTIAKCVGELLEQGTETLYLGISANSEQSDLKLAFKVITKFLLGFSLEVHRAVISNLFDSLTDTESHSRSSSSDNVKNEVREINSHIKWLVDQCQLGSAIVGPKKKNSVAYPNSDQNKNEGLVKIGTEESKKALDEKHFKELCHAYKDVFKLYLDEYDDLEDMSDDVSKYVELWRKNNGLEGIDPSELFKIPPTESEIKLQSKKLLLHTNLDEGEVVRAFYVNGTQLTSSAEVLRTLGDYVNPYILWGLKGIKLEKVENLNAVCHKVVLTLNLAHTPLFRELKLEVKKIGIDHMPGCLFAEFNGLKSFLSKKLDSQRILTQGGAKAEPGVPPTPKVQNKAPDAIHQTSAKASPAMGKNHARNVRKRRRLKAKKVEEKKAGSSRSL
jgi:hypothetical protein